MMTWMMYDMYVMLMVQIYIFFADRKEEGRRKKEEGRRKKEEASTSKYL